MLAALLVNSSGPTALVGDGGPGRRIVHVETLPWTPPKKSFEAEFREIMELEFLPKTPGAVPIRTTVRARVIEPIVQAESVVEPSPYNPTALLIILAASEL